ncbi:MAG TPA: ABC transporter ATP-binding protein [Acidimicrobiales bacterium]|nr:ABC transporter ATP-binding protein [Acidimicrobiales bacterium]
MLRVDDVVVTYGDEHAVDGVTLHVERGEVVALLGPSGSGKTSLLRAIAGLELPTRGTVAWEGTDVTRTPPHERGFGLVFQDFALFPHLDVAGNVGFGTKGAGVTDALALVGLTGYERRRIDTLSGGEAQRVAVARALAPRPGLLLLDEPLGSLDRPLRERLTTELRRLLHELDVAAVHVTHDQHEALAIADRVVLLRDGRIAQEGAPADVWRAPVDEWVARFLGFTNIVPTGDGSHVQVLSPDAVSLAATGGTPGTVRAVTFRSGGFVATVVTDDRTVLEVPVRGEAVPQQGERVHVAVDPRWVRTVPALPSP